MSQVAEASESKMPNGASTLPKAAFALGFDMGLDAPQPLLFGFRMDYGVTYELQLGAPFSTIGRAARERSLREISSTSSHNCIAPTACKIRNPLRAGSIGPTLSTRAWKKEFVDGSSCVDNGAHGLLLGWHGGCRIVG
jgi:hypothetical protein